ncbi:Peptidyl-prolyl cis-trans isomerase, cyclophilin-type [Niveomyces insectorum RCEF 264]|uniref:Peptidyl-prolyl cis-trans isomerase n=1 Tax=Niveomyces insectorum RCEF 264 TaxID=1081102 RepID=A0A162J9W4_9HYPO|nr:Peptidyl-prolyl cis-trans isomerase, cyclophilin-type [Niveomyces insectorum RCEF 264]
MSVLLETSLGDIVIDLLVDYAPKLCENFLKLCKAKYYNFSPVHSVQKDFSFQTGDPLGPLSPASDGGTSIWGLVSSDPAKRTFPALFHPKLKHTERGTVGMATVAHASDPDVRLAASQFIVTLGDNTDYLDGKSAIFGRVVEGFDVLDKINNAIVDSNGYPLADIRIKHTVVLDDPYPDPAGLTEPSSSPAPTRAQLATVRLGEDEQAKLGDGSNDGNDDDDDKAAALEKARREREARAQALTLEMMGDLPFAEVKPPENVLFVCKLNPVTQDADLELIFSRFGTILSCEVIRDAKTGDSLQYAFIEFADKSACEAAYFKMQDVLIDDRRIHVDFSQSVSKLSDSWRNETNTKRRNRANKGRGGGWGGIQELEKWRKYRNEDLERAPDYEMVHGEEEMQGQHASSSHARRTYAARDEEADPAASGRRSRDGDNNNYGDRKGRGYGGRDDADTYRRRERDRSVERGRGKERGPPHREPRDREWGQGPPPPSARSRSRDRQRHHGERGRDALRGEGKPRYSARSRSPRRNQDRAYRDDRDRRGPDSDRRGARSRR